MGMLAGVKPRCMNKSNIPFEELTLRDEARIRAALRRKRRGGHRERLLQSLEHTIERSQAVVVARAVRVPISYPMELPVSQAVTEIRGALAEYQVVIVCGDTGSGKTTQLPKLLYEMGYGKRGRIGCTQPRRLAAVSMARRVAEEMKVEVGTVVGHHVRFDETFTAETSIKFMTDGIMLAEMPHDRLWLQYDALIIDEAHERSLNIDFILGRLQSVLEKRPNLRVVISSATLDAGRFSQFFSDAPVIQVKGRRYPVEDFYLPPLHDDEDLARQVLRGVEWINEIDARGDVLIFLPGEREIRESAELLTGQRWAHTEILPLYARLSMGEQQRVFQVGGGRRRIVLATNVAETSITIPGIHYVVDSGLARVKRYNPRLRIERLQLEQISQASANQRRGRCGRIAEGICVRLYDEEVFAESDTYTMPEIQRSSLADVILHMNMSGMPPVEAFPFIDPPKMPLINEGYKTLLEIGALDKQRQLTPIGREIGRFRIEPRIARMLVEARRLNCLADVLVVTAALSIQDPRERPMDRRAEADIAQACWKDPRSDFCVLLNIWQDWKALKKGGASRTQQRNYCRKHYLNLRRMWEWENLHRELVETAKTLKWDGLKKRPKKQDEQFEALHKSVLAGVPLQFGVKDEQRAYRGTQDRMFYIFPGSGLHQTTEEWVLAFEWMQTSRLFARMVAMMAPEWVEEIAPHLCKAVYSNPYWSAEKGFVYAEKSLVCGGLTVYGGRRIHYGGVDLVKARQIFLREGLVPGNLRCRGRWMKRYRAQLEGIKNLELKIRRPESLLHYAQVEELLDADIPKEICSAPDFEKWVYKHPDAIKLSQEDMLLPQSVPVTGANYPDELEVEGISFPLIYRFDPGEVHDGVTLICPLDRAYIISQADLDWLIPGWLQEKIYLLLRTLTKRIRQRLNPLQHTARDLTERFLQGKVDRTKPIAETLAHIFRDDLEEIVGAGDFDETELPHWLRMKMRVVDKAGATIVEDADVECVRDALPLPDVHVAPVEKGKDSENKIAMSCSFADGVPALFRKRQKEQVRFVEKRLPLGMATRLKLSMLGGGHDHFHDFVEGVIALTFLGEGGMPSTLNAYEQMEEACRAGMYGVAEDSAAMLERIFSELSEIESAMNSEGSAFELLRNDVQLQLDDLFFAGFLLHQEYLPDYLRWMNALKLRVERAHYNPDKDAQKHERVRLYQEQFHNWLGGGDSVSAPVRLEGRHMLQEFRVAVFAPEVGVRLKVSEKRLSQFFSK